MITSDTLTTVTRRRVRALTLTDAKTAATRRMLTLAPAKMAWEVLTAVSMTVGRGPAARTMTDLADLTPGDRLVDVGCGAGRGRTDGGTTMLQASPESIPRP